MIRSRIYSLIVTLAILFGACSTGNNEADAFGNFEATEVMISAEATGKILDLNLDEGDVFEKEQQVGFVDSLQLSLQKKQLLAQRKAIASGIRNVLSRIEVEKEQKAILLKDKVRIEQMFKQGAATQKQVDDVNGNLSLIESRIQSIKTENAKILGELEGLDRNIDRLDDQIGKCEIYIPMPATVLEKYMEEHELVKAGTPLFKIANLQQMLKHADEQKAVEKENVCKYGLFGFCRKKK